MKRLESERLILREWKVSDLDDLHQISSNKKVSDLAGFRLKTTKEDSFENLKKFIAASDESNWKVKLRDLEQVVFWAIELRGVNKAVGWFELVQASARREVENLECAKEIGFVLAEEYWGQGIMPEAINLVLAYLFDEVGIDVVVCSHYKDNIQSEKAMKKCGLEFYMEDDGEKYYFVTKN